MNKHDIISGVPPGRLADNVRAVSKTKGRQLPCNTEMAALLNCFKEFDFAVEHCVKEHRILGYLVEIGSQICNFSSNELEI